MLYNILYIMRIEQDIPSAERLEATYDGLTYGDFKQLDDAAVDAIWESHRANADYSWLQIEPEDRVVEASSDTPTPPKGGNTLRDFTRWRQFGIPDRVVTWQDIQEYAIDAADAKRSANATWGTIPASHFEGWNQNDYASVKFILDYCYQMRSLTEQPAIDTYSLYDTIGLTREDVAAMVEKGVLNPMGGEASYIGPDDTIYHNYYLGGIYFDNFFAVITNWAKRRLEEPAQKKLS
ncbi:MAG: hypothetical protein JWN38_1011 [Candidatus Saccharibacteria bacterium]|nr:hypothetical protein [Candidatus Saccharibacteria bacterium]